MKTILVLGGFYVVTSFITFIAYAIDKSAARNRRWRTKERTLQFFSLIGGWPGALIAQNMLSHKTSKTAFQNVSWITVIVNCFALGWLVTTKSGSDFLVSITNLLP
jgi:uncharacterized membrane protein YsdA (DUF1294 family)